MRKRILDNQHIFIPFMFDTFDFLAPEVVDLYKVQMVMYNNVTSPRSMNVVFTRIGFVILNGLITQLIARLPFVSSHLIIIFNELSNY